MDESTHSRYGYPAIMVSHGGANRRQPAPPVNPESRMARRDKLDGVGGTMENYVDFRELLDLWHVARIELGNPTRHQQMCWVADHYHKAHPEVSATRAYKALERAIEGS